MADNPEKVTLQIGGVNWLGWKSAEVSRQVDAAAGSFALGLTDKWAPNQEAKPIAAGMACKVLANGEPLADGYLDKVTLSFSRTEHSIQVSGRDKSADLVDCSAVHKPGHWQGQTSKQLAEALAGPYGVQVKLEGEDGPAFEDFKLEVGETSFQALDRVLRQRGLLPVPDGQGGLRLIKLGEKRAGTSLIQGRNVLEASASYDVSDRHSKYITKGQRKGSDDDYGQSVSEIEGEGDDPAVTRYRPLLVRPESQVTRADAKARAEWEASVRAARGVTVSVTVQGWRQDDGQLWDVGLLVSCDIPYLRLQQDLLLSKVTFSQSRDQGTLAKLELKDPKAFDKQPPKAKGKGKGGDLQSLSMQSAEEAHREIMGG